MEGVVNASSVDFVIVRPPLLTDDPTTGNIKIVGGHDKGHKITRGDLAQFLVDQLTTDENLNRAVVIANS
jgi:hypothetical protein